VDSYLSGCVFHRDVVRKRLRHWKVPYREVYCTTFRVWIAEVIYEHVVKRLDR
jgi:hypothetical protein